MNTRESLSVQWSPALEESLMVIIREYRHARRDYITSTPQMMALALKQERNRERTLLNRLRLTLGHHPPETIDLGIQDACHRLKARLERAPPPPRGGARRLLKPERTNRGLRDRIPFSWGRLVACPSSIAYVYRQQG